MEFTFGEVLILATLLLFYFILNYFLPNFFSAKGKNLATKQDIAAITNLVESVKHTFTIESELIKSKLNTYANINTKLIDTEINCIISLNESYFYFLKMLTDASLNGIDFRNNEELVIYKKEISIAYNKMLSRETQLTLFVAHNELTESFAQLKILTLGELHSNIHEFIINLKANNIQREAILDARLGTTRILLQKLNTEMSEYQEKFNKNVTNNYKAAMSDAIKFQFICREYIKNLLKEQK